MNVVVVSQAGGVGQQATDEHAKGEKVSQIAPLSHQARDEHAKSVGEKERRVEQREQCLRVMTIEWSPTTVGLVGAIRTAMVKHVLHNTERTTAQMEATVGQIGE